MLLLTEFACGVILTFEDPCGLVKGASAKLTDLVHCSQFSMILLTDFGSRGDPNVRVS